MSDKSPNFREERIEKLLRELEYEIVRGLNEREIGEEMTFQFVFPRSRIIPDGVVLCQFRTRPAPPYAISFDMYEPKLRVVK